MVATGLGHQPRTCLAMPDVGRRLVERRAPQLVMAASAGDQEMTHAFGHPWPLPVLACRRRASTQPSAACPALASAERALLGLVLE